MCNFSLAVLRRALTFLPLSKWCNSERAASGHLHFPCQRTKLPLSYLVAHRPVIHSGHSGHSLGISPSPGLFCSIPVLHQLCYLFHHRWFLLLASLPHPTSLLSSHFFSPLSSTASHCGRPLLGCSSRLRRRGGETGRRKPPRPAPG